MRIRIGEHIKEVNEVSVRSTDIIIGIKFYFTGEDTEKIGKQLLEQGYADLTNYNVKS